jgi:hypothetical protein
VIEVACDESGYEGEHLVGGVTEVFAHAGVHIELDAAQECVARLRERIRSPALEYKANHLLRAKHRDVLDWMLGADGPLAGAATVHLVDKTYFAAVRLAELLTDRPMSPALHREALGPRWVAVLAAFDTLMRTRDVATLDAAAARFAQVTGGALGDANSAGVAALLGEVAGAAQQAARLRRAFLADPSAVPPLDPLVPAIRATVASWSERTGQRIHVVHDRQTTLGADRIARIGGELAGLRLVDSRLDARVQLADFLAGIATRIASRALAGHPDLALVTALAEFTDPHSLWSHEPSATALGISPARAAPGRRPARQPPRAAPGGSSS